MGFEVAQFICLTDNFGLLAHDAQSGATATSTRPTATPSPPRRSAAAGG